MLPAHDGAGGIVGKRQYQQFGTRRDGGAKLLGSQAESIFGAGGNGDNLGISQGAHGRIRHKARFRQKNFIAGIDDRTDTDVDGLGAADSDENFVFGIVFQ